MATVLTRTKQRLCSSRQLRSTSLERSQAALSDDEDAGVNAVDAAALACSVGEDRDLDGCDSGGDTTEGDAPGLRPGEEQLRVRRVGGVSESSDSGTDQPVKSRRGRPRVGRSGLGAADEKPIAACIPSRARVVRSPARVAATLVTAAAGTVPQARSGLRRLVGVGRQVRFTGERRPRRLLRRRHPWCLTMLCLLISAYSPRIIARRRLLLPWVP